MAFISKMSLISDLKKKKKRLDQQSQTEEAAKQQMLCVCPSPRLFDSREVDVCVRGQIGSSWYLSEPHEAPEGKSHGATQTRQTSQKILQITIDGKGQHLRHECSEETRKEGRKGERKGQTDGEEQKIRSDDGDGEMEPEKVTNQHRLQMADMRAEY